ncbi:hypothetical protein LCGC14_1993650 [marine sediment metagenome]|uniref:Uncharacterized protein n=1 Tax=marine sediment metagenome TaxID=412755 RepID=A0A0F9FTC5_9ZZZZ
MTHPHTYERVRGSKHLYRCIHPDCSHYTHKKFLKGKRAICNGCLEEFALTTIALRRARPKCNTCRASFKRKEKSSELTERIEESLTKL